ncbi:hypothetical protein EKG38_24555 [Shewanella canadensis]|uniref:Uncharacterized protein n=1 Tax=Shewanella canadensis TaxID=271096 RepID=A0A431WK59_9GAMM|nr:hypothetical protein [Shewanella canadensis]RTR35887.1 hypothetical protein EKG38_24555 [Shewanella canadensis]
MDEIIEVSVPRIQEIIDAFDASEFSTADVLREYSGGFYSNVGTPAHYSFNAQFGKLLQRNCESLRITENRNNVSIKDDNGHKTSTSFWRKFT